MTLLVADIGGTNTRIGLAQCGHPVDSLERFQNDEFPSFDAVLARYSRDRDLSSLTGACIAVAGPVTAGSAKLTNRDWRFEEGAIATLLPGLSAAHVHLINDLAALGYSLPDLDRAHLATIRDPADTGPQNNQALVVGVGTGFNICLVRPTRTGPIVIEAELGHASLPARVVNVLEQAIGAEIVGFSTYEHLLSGRGLCALYRVVSGGDEKTGPQILAGFDQDQPNDKVRTVELIAQVLGIVARELVFQYQPYGGIHFAGGVARGLMASPARAIFLDAFNAPGAFDDLRANVAIKVITDDAAALIGAVRFANDRAREGCAAAS